MTYKFVGLGEVLWDMFPEGKMLGGAPANFAYHAKMIASGHVQSFIVSSIGNDELGIEIEAALSNLNLDQSYLSLYSKHPTGAVTVEIDANGSPAYSIDQDVAWDYIPKISTEFAKSVDVVCFGTLAQRSSVSKNSIQQFLADVPEAALRIFDINLRQSYYSLNLIRESLALANVFKVNDDEIVVAGNLLGIAGEEDYIMQEIVDRYGLKLGILTKGKEGSTLISAEKISSCSGFDVSIKDSVGAGDAFTAAVAVGLLCGYDLDYVNESANKLAAYVCSVSGATPEVPEEIALIFKQEF